MSFKQWCKSWLTRAAARSRRASPRKYGLRPTLELLENRSLPSSLTLASVSPLTADIHASAHTVMTLAMNAASKHGGPAGSADGGPAGSSGGL
jgi:hypothetical protein